MLKIKNNLNNEIEIIKSKIEGVDKFVNEKLKIQKDKSNKRSEICEHISSILKKLKIKDLNFEKLNSIENLNFDIIKSDAEMKLLEEMLNNSKKNKCCDFCNQKLSIKNISYIEEENSKKISNLVKNIDSFRIDLKENNLILSEIKKSQPEINKINELKSSIDEIENEIKISENEKNGLSREKLLCEEKFIQISQRFINLDKEIINISEYLEFSGEVDDLNNQFKNSLNHLNLTIINENDFEGSYIDIQNILIDYEDKIIQMRIKSE